MPVLPAYIAAALALLIFLAMALLVSWGWKRGYSDASLYTESLVTLAMAGIVTLCSGFVALAAWRGSKVPVPILLIVLLAAGAATVLAGWSLIYDPGDAFWVVPPMGCFAVCSVWSVWAATRRSEG